jgi:hypothetical protein
MSASVLTVDAVGSSPPCPCSVDVTRAKSRTNDSTTLERPTSITSHGTSMLRAFCSALREVYVYVYVCVCVCVRVCVCL